MNCCSVVTTHCAYARGMVNIILSLRILDANTDIDYY